MTVSRINATNGPFAANGATSAFPFTFQALSADDVGVTIDGAVRTSGYSVTLNAGGLGGTLIFDTPPISGAVLIYAQPPFEQSVAFANAGAFLPEALDNALDQAALRDIYLRNLIENTAVASPDGPLVLAQAAAALAVSAAAGLNPSAYFIVTPQMFGSVVGDATAAIQAALTSLAAAGGGVLTLPPGTYSVTSLACAGSDIITDARGAIITSALTSSAAVVSLSGARCKVVGGTWKLTAGSANPWFFDVTGVDCETHNVRRVKTPDAGGYHDYIRHTADGYRSVTDRYEGSNGVYVEASNVLFAYPTMIGRAAGGDDAIAVKAISDSARNIRVIGGYFENLASGLSIGSEIGVLGANDSTYSRTVGQVVFAGNTLKNCYSIAYIKPGAISGSDYRDGTVEDVLISNNALADLSGAKFERGIVISAGRGARVRGIKGRNNSVRARSAGGSGRLIGAVDIYLTDDAGGTAEANVSDVDLQVSYTDPYSGLANDGSHPGYPVTYGAAVQVATYGTGVFSDIQLGLSINGSAQSAIVIGPSSPADLDGKVELTRVRIANSNQTNAAGQGGLILSNAIKISDPNPSIAPAFGSAYNFTLLGAVSGPAFYGLKSTVDKIGYGVGGGGTVTQPTSKATAAPALNRPSGEVTMHNASLAAGATVSFTMPNSFAAAHDTVTVNHVSGGTIGSYTTTGVASAGTITFYVRNNTAGALAEALVLRFSLGAGEVT